MAKENIFLRVFSRLALDEATGCWNCIAYRDRLGYGRFESRGLHRVVYELLRGPVPDGLVLDHLCRNTSCANPNHLEPVTDQVNILRGDTVAARNAAKTHCKNGHDFAIYGKKTKHGRKCRACNKEWMKEYHKRPEVVEKTAKRKQAYWKEYSLRRKAAK